MNQSGEFCKLMVFMGAKVTNIVQIPREFGFFIPKIS